MLWDMEEKCKLFVCLQGNCIAAGEENIHTENNSEQAVRKYRTVIQDPWFLHPAGSPGARQTEITLVIMFNF